jgi:hypothetical protein
LPKTQIRGAQLTVKVLLHDDGKGKIVAKLANEQTAASAPAESVSTLTVDFNVGAYPSME